MPNIQTEPYNAQLVTVSHVLAIEGATPDEKVLKLDWHEITTKLTEDSKL